MLKLSPSWFCDKHKKIRSGGCNMWSDQGKWVIGGNTGYEIKQVRISSLVLY